jgi:hypothetical protein
LYQQHHHRYPASKKLSISISNTTNNLTHRYALDSTSFAAAAATATQPAFKKVSMHVKHKSHSNGAFKSGLQHFATINPSNKIAEEGARVLTMEGVTGVNGVIMEERCQSQMMLQEEEAAARIVWGP